MSSELYRSNISCDGADGANIIGINRGSFGSGSFASLDAAFDQSGPMSDFKIKCVDHCQMDLVDPRDLKVSIRIKSEEKICKNIDEIVGAIYNHNQQMPMTTPTPAQTPTSTAITAPMSTQPPSIQSQSQARIQPYPMSPVPMYSSMVSPGSGHGPVEKFDTRQFVNEINSTQPSRGTNFFKSYLL